MTARALLLAAGLISASFSPAFAENITATVLDWDAAQRTLTLEDQTKFVHIPDSVAIPPGLKANDRVTIEFEGSENGVEDIEHIKLAK